MKTTDRILNHLIATNRNVWLTFGKDTWCIKADKLREIPLAIIKLNIEDLFNRYENKPKIEFM